MRVACCPSWARASEAAMVAFLVAATVVVTLLIVAVVGYVIDRSA
jgi:hypothetical protein